MYNHFLFPVICHVKLYFQNTNDLNLNGSVERLYVKCEYFKGSWDHLTKHRPQARLHQEVAISKVILRRVPRYIHIPSKDKELEEVSEEFVRF